MIGKLQRVPLRDVWKHEALDFTKWLEDNPDVLSDALGVTLSNIEREKNAGEFSIDLSAEDESGALVIIENQLEKSNHDHLGKVLTYLAAIEAKVAVWIVSDPRPEHVKAIAWLNDSSSADFYMLKVEAVRIEDSSPAPLLTRIVGPSVEGKSVGSTKKDIAERHTLRRKFWSQFIGRLKSRKVSMHANLAPTNAPWLSTTAGKSGLSFGYMIHMTDAMVYFYIDRGKGAEDETQRVFKDMLAHKDEIEKAYDKALVWSSNDGARRCMISDTISIGGLRQEEKWDQVQDGMIDAMTRLERSLRPYIDQVQV